MTADIDSIVLEHLRHIRGKVDTLADDSIIIKARLNSLDNQVNGLRGDIKYLHEDMAIVHVRMDQIDKRLGRIESRLDLADATP